MVIYETKCGHILRVRLMGRDNSVDAIAVSMPADTPEELRGKWIETINDRMLSILRITFDQSTDVVRFGDQFVNLAATNDDELPTYSFTITPTLSEAPFNFQSAAALFAFIDNREKDDVFALIAEGQSPGIPRHYRILSLVRALEVLLPSPRDRGAWLDEHQPLFEDKGLSSRQLRNALPELRDRCAHGTLRSDERPLTGPAYGNVADLHTWTLLLRQIVLKLAAERFGLEMIDPTSMKLPDDAVARLSEQC